MRGAAADFSAVPTIGLGRDTAGAVYHSSRTVPPLKALIQHGELHNSKSFEFLEFDFKSFFHLCLIRLPSKMVEASDMSCAPVIASQILLRRRPTSASGKLRGSVVRCDRLRLWAELTGLKF